MALIVLQIRIRNENITKTITIVLGQKKTGQSIICMANAETFLLQGLQTFGSSECLSTK